VANTQITGLITSGQIATVANTQITGNPLFSAGSNTAPSITTSGDTNTGIFFSAADTIDFTEGGTAVGQFDSSANFKFNSGYGSVAVAYGCRAWVNFNGTGTVAIRASGNVTSITDNDTGDYTVNFTTAMPDTNYAVVTGMSGNANTTNGNEFYVSTQIVGPAYNAGYTTTGSIRMLSMDGTGSHRDCADLNLAVFR
jgi:hypothetical protein